MRKHTGPALLAIILGALVTAASPAWAQERSPNSDPIRVNDTFTCPEGSSPVPDDATDSGLTCVEDAIDPETDEPYEESGPTSTTIVIDDDDSEPPRPTSNTYDDTVTCDVSDQDQRSSDTTLCDTTPTTGVEDDDDTGVGDDDTEAPGPTATTTMVGTVSPEDVVDVTSPAPATTVQSGEEELPFTGTSSAVPVAGLAFLVVGVTVFLVARVKPKH
jgi:hypothetical protein